MGHEDRLSVKLVIVPPVVELLLDAAAHLKTQTGVYITSTSSRLLPNGTPSEITQIFCHAKVRRGLPQPPKKAIERTIHHYQH